MNLKILFMLLMYWTIWIVFTASVSGEYFYQQTYFNTTAGLNDTGLTANETDTGGLFSTGVSLARYFAFVLFGINAPFDAPDWFTLILASWQTVLTVFTVGWVISSIWDG